LPTLVNLLAAFFLLRLFYRKQFNHQTLISHPEGIKDPGLARLSQISLVLLAILVLAKIITVFAGLKIDFRLTYIALTAALPIIIFSPKRLTIIRRIDWTTLIFFAAMFIMMAAVWNSGVFSECHHFHEYDADLGAGDFGHQRSFKPVYFQCPAGGALPADVNETGDQRRGPDGAGCRQHDRR